MVLLWQPLCKQSLVHPKVAVGKAKVDIEPDQEIEVGQFTSGTCGQFGLATSIKSGTFD
ncbi:hypothetical protein IFM89_004944 [Coptis chinensis]|uniref:Uncharacterized protein n=1 Tax=Coptis chinensis TaxID=261450 RepID=A0A835LQE6_9MAGN|nr:hypothetical protein IFM89_004944 [Coptis chinensis]